MDELITELQELLKARLACEVHVSIDPSDDSRVNVVIRNTTNGKAAELRRLIELKVLAAVGAQIIVEELRVEATEGLRALGLNV